MDPAPAATDQALTALGVLLQDELSAVATYDRIIAEFGSDAPIELDECLRSHHVRVQELSVRIFELGGKPDSSGSLWDSILELVEGGAALFGRKTAVSTLLDGEISSYAVGMAKLEELDTSSRRLVESKILPEHLKTQFILRNLNHHSS